jgi:hypothetical protein
VPANVRRNLVLSLDPNSGVAALKVDLIGPQRLPIGVPLGTAGYNNAVGFAGRGGGGPPYTFSILSGAIPTGLTFNNITGQWSGTPSVQGGFNFVARISDGTITTDRAFHVEVFGNMYPLFGHYSPTPAVRTRPYSYQVLFADANGSTAGITYTLSPGSGALPTGITLSTSGLLSAASVTGAIGTYWFSVRGTKAGATVDVPMAITVRTNMTALGVAAAADATLGTMLVGQPVDAQVNLTGGGGAVGMLPLIWSISSGTLPAGLSLVNMKDGTARIRGTPTAITDNTFVQPVLTVTDATGQSRNVTFGSGGVTAISVNTTLRASTGPGRQFVTNALGIAQDVDVFGVYFGDGSDGDVTINGANAVPGTTLSGGVNTATRDLYLNNVTFTAAGFLRMNGFDLYVNGVLDLTNASAGAINADGRDATGAGGAAAAAYGTAGGAGAAGTTTVGGNGSGSTSIHVGGGGHGRNGGAGGAGSSGAGGTGGAGANIDITATPRNLQQGDVYQVDDGTARFELSGIGAGTGGGGGGGGGGNGSAAGGQGAGGGGSAGRLNVYARTIRRVTGTTAAGAIRAKGGKGFNGGNGPAAGRGAGGGGGGGGGGKTRVVCGSLDGSAVAGLIQAPGGDGGNGGASGGIGSTAGGGGRGGDGGSITLTNLGDGTTTQVIGSAAAAPVGATGSAGGACAVSL